MALFYTQKLRDGNVAAGFQRGFERPSGKCRKGKTQIRYGRRQHDLLRYCEKGENRRFDRIELQEVVM